MKYLISISSLLFLWASPVAAQKWYGRDTVYVSDRYLVDTTSTAAIIVAKFATPESRTAALRLDLKIGTYQGNPWTLGDILVTADINGNGYVMTTTIAGPRQMVDRYVQMIEQLARNRSPIYDHAVYRLMVRCACD